MVHVSICSNDAWHSLEIPITLLSSIQSPLIILTEYSWKKYSRLVFSKTSRHSGQLLKLSQVTFKLYLYLRMCSINQHKAQLILPANVNAIRMLIIMNNSQQLHCAELSCEYRSGNRVVTSNSRQIHVKFASHRRKFELGFSWLTPNTWWPSF